jgi:hypothetical protein
MKHCLLMLLLLSGLLSGCAVTLHGVQTVSGGQSATTTGSSLQGGGRIGNARVAGSFGAPPPANAAGGQISFSRGASAVLVIGVLIAGAVDEIGAWFRSPGTPQAERLPEGPISQTCSCYGWRPEPAPAQSPQ